MYEPGRLSRAWRLLPWALGVAIALLTAGAYTTVGRHERREIREVTRVTTDLTRRRFELWFGERHHALERLADASLARAEPERFRDKALELIDWFPGFQAVNRLDTNGVARVVVPLEGNEAVLDFDLHRHPDPSVTAALDAAASRRTATRSRVVELRQGGRGFGTYVPILDERGELAGFVNGVFRIEGAFRACLPESDLPAEFAVEIVEDRNVLFSRWDPDPDAPVEESALSLFDRPLTLRMAATRPLVEAHRSGTEQFLLASGLSAALLSAFALRLLLARYEQRRRAEARRLDLERERARTSRLESIGRLAGGVAHDFNNYLTAILGSSELALADLPADSPAREPIEVSIQAARRAAEVTQRLLTFARRSPGEPTVIDPCRLVEDLSRMLPRLLGEDVDLRIETNEDAGHVRIDPTQLEQVLINLAVNARDAMPVGGVLALRVLPEGEDWVRIEVEDNGIGMDEEFLAHVFEPFVTSKPEGHGTGLGLATCYGIIKGAGGEIEVRSRVGEGTRVLVRLPRTRAPLEAEEESSRPATSAPLPGSLVLVAEDQPLVRAVVEETLRGAGCDVLSAPDGGTALELARRESRPIALLVTDIVMPRMSGRELAAALRRERPGTPVLFLSGYSDQPPAEGDALLAKPFTPEQLLAAVGRLLAPQAAERG